MEKHRLNSIFFIIIILILLITTGLMIFFNVNLSRQNKKLLENNFSQDSLSPRSTNKILKSRSEQSTRISKESPIGMSGVIETVENEMLIVRQSSNIKILYEIKKDDIEKIVKSEKNTNFNKEKTMQMQQIIESKINSSYFISKDEILANPNIPEEVKSYIQSPEAQSTLEKEMDWNDLKSGMKINLSTNEDGKKKLTVLSEELDTSLGNPLADQPQ